MLMNVTNQIKVQHWRTTTYADHALLDSLHSELTKKTDEWVETFQGKYGRVWIAKEPASLVIHNQMQAHRLRDTARNLMLLKESHFVGA